MRNIERCDTVAWGTLELNLDDVAAQIAVLRAERQKQQEAQRASAEPPRKSLVARLRQIFGVDDQGEGGSGSPVK